jgi:hypothetical protein
LVHTDALAFIKCKRLTKDAEHLTKTWP